MNDKKGNQTSLWQRLWAPFRVLKIEKLYGFWFVSFILSFTGIIIDWFNGNIYNSFLQGAFFSTGMAVLVPTFFEFLVEYQSSNRKSQKEKYSTYKSVTMGLSLTMLFFLVLFYVTDLKSSIVIQIISFVAILLLSFYTYLVTKMSHHNKLFEDFKDRPYIETEMDELRKIKNKSKKLKKRNVVINEEGDSVKL